MSDELTMILGLDVGNGYTKGKATFTNVRDKNTVYTLDAPSVISYTSGVDIPTTPSDELMDNFASNIDATIVSKSIKELDAGRVFVGQRAINTGESLREFDIHDHKPKCQDALSTILILTSIASLALKRKWQASKQLPKSLKVNVALGIALPIADFTTWKDVYSRTLTKNEHQVIVHNFEQNIPVTVEFKTVQVLAEGAAAQYAIQDLGPEFLQMAIDQARAGGAPIDPAYTGQLLSKAENTIGIDVGEGTTNFPVFTGGLINVEASRSINRGYGSVLSKVIELTRDEYPFETRKDLGSFLLRENLMPAQVMVRQNVEKVLREQVNIFTRDVLREFKGIFSRVGVRSDVIYIYGGGAAQVHDPLYNQILEAATFTSANGEHSSSLPVIYLDARYSRNLNRSGLWRIAHLGAQNVGMV